MVGHEVVGRVTRVGAAVTDFKVGDRVGFGPQRDCCAAHSCEGCEQHIENTCASFAGLYDPEFGGYATSITVPQRFTFHIPASIPSHLAGPLLCAGVTTHAPLSRNVKPGDRVGIVGVGGLGHLGLQYAKALGAGEVFAISSSAGKQEEARSFGATHFLVSSDAAAMKLAERTFDFILCTAASQFSVADYMKLLKPRRTFCLVGLPPVSEPLAVYPFDVVVGERRLEGSMIGGTDAMREMLEFSAKHQIVPQVEVIPLEDAQQGIDKIIAGKPRYRMVLQVEGVRERLAAAAAAAPK